jgi:hypothetical protein
MTRRESGRGNGGGLASNNSLKAQTEGALRSSSSGTVPRIQTSFLHSLTSDENMFRSQQNLGPRDNPEEEDANGLRTDFPTKNPKTEMRMQSMFTLRQIYKQGTNIRQNGSPVPDSDDQVLPPGVCQIRRRNRLPHDGVAPGLRQEDIAWRKMVHGL